jgi:hypothetical protein
MGAAFDSFGRWRFRAWSSRLLRRRRSVHDTGDLSAGPLLEDIAEDRSEGGQLGMKHLPSRSHLVPQRLEANGLLPTRRGPGARAITTTSGRPAAARSGIRPGVIECPKCQRGALARKRCFGPLGAFLARAGGPDTCDTWRHLRSLRFPSVTTVTSVIGGRARGNAASSSDQRLIHPPAHAWRVAWRVFWVVMFRGAAGAGVGSPILIATTIGAALPADQAEVTDWRVAPAAAGSLVSNHGSWFQSSGLTP